MKRRLSVEDPDQDSVYYSERVAFESTLFEESMSSGEFIRLAERLFSHDWWERHRLPIPVIEPTLVKDVSSYALINKEDVAKDPIIRVFPTRVSAWELAHEAAHIAQYHFYTPGSYGQIEVHGREFRATYLRVAEIVLGREAADVLRGTFERFVKTRPEHAPGMPGSIMTVPRLNPNYDQSGTGLYQTMRLEQQMRDFDALRVAVATSPRRVNGAIAL